MVLRVQVKNADGFRFAFTEATENQFIYMKKPSPVPEYFWSPMELNTQCEKRHYQGHARPFAESVWINVVLLDGMVPRASKGAY